MKRAFFLILTCAALASCGVKPGSVEPPGGTEHDQFPHTYPDLATDPPPAGGWH